MKRSCGFNQYDVVIGMPKLLQCLHLINQYALVSRSHWARASLMDMKGCKLTGTPRGLNQLRNCQRLQSILEGSVKLNLKVSWTAESSDISSISNYNFFFSLRQQKRERETKSTSHLEAENTRRWLFSLDRRLCNWTANCFRSKLKSHLIKAV